MAMDDWQQPAEPSYQAKHTGPLEAWEVREQRHAQEWAASLPQHWSQLTSGGAPPSAEVCESKPGAAPPTPASAPTPTAQPSAGGITAEDEWVQPAVLDPYSF